MARIKKDKDSGAVIASIDMDPEFSANQSRMRNAEAIDRAASEIEDYAGLIGRLEALGSVLGDDDEEIGVATDTGAADAQPARTPDAEAPAADAVAPVVPDAPDHKEPAADAAGQQPVHDRDDAARADAEVADTDDVTWIAGEETKLSDALAEAEADAEAEVEDIPSEGFPQLDPDEVIRNARASGMLLQDETGIEEESDDWEIEDDLEDLEDLEADLDEDENAASEPVPTRKRHIRDILAGAQDEDEHLRLFPEELEEDEDTWQPDLEDLDDHLEQPSEDGITFGVPLDDLPEDVPTEETRVTSEQDPDPTPWEGEERKSSTWEDLDVSAWQDPDLTPDPNPDPNYAAAGISEKDMKNHIEGDLMEDKQNEEDVLMDEDAPDIPRKSGRFSGLKTYLLAGAAAIAIVGVSVATTLALVDRPSDQGWTQAELSPSVMPAPTAPATPAPPTAPEVPAAPEAPAAATQPEVPAAPEAPVMPQAPAAPEAPAEGTQPEAPAAAEPEALPAEQGPADAIDIAELRMPEEAEASQVPAEDAAEDAVPSLDPLQFSPEVDRDQADAGAGTDIPDLRDLFLDFTDPAEAGDTEVEAAQAQTEDEVFIDAVSMEDFEALAKSVETMNANLEEVFAAIEERDAIIRELSEQLEEANAQARRAESLALAQNEVLVRFVSAEEKLDMAEHLIVDLSRRLAEVEVFDPADRGEVEGRLARVEESVSGLNSDIGMVARMVINGSPERIEGRRASTQVFDQAEVEMRSPVADPANVPADVSVGDFVNGFGAVLEIFQTSTGGKMVVMENGTVILN